MNKQEIIKNIQLIQKEYIEKKGEIIDNDVLHSGKCNLFFYFTKGRFAYCRLTIIDNGFVITFPADIENVLKYLSDCQNKIKNI